MIKLTSTKSITSDRFVALIMGMSGVGKTTLAKTLPPKETLILSSESGLLALKGTDIAVYDVTKDDDGNVIMDMESRLDRVKGFVGFLMTDEARQYKNIFIDSITDVGDIWVKALMARSEYKDPKMALKMWGQYDKEFSGFIKFIRDMSYFNVFFTCLIKEEKKGFDIVERPHVPGNNIKNNLKAWFDEVLVYQLFETEEATHRKLITDYQINSNAKDRSNTLDKYEDPDLSAIIAKVLTKQGEKE